MQIIETRNLSKKFGNHLAVSDVTLAIARGESFALLGPNGAGKTTLVRILSTLIKPSSGTAKINGYDIVEDAEEVKRCIGVVSHNLFLYDELTARENLEFYANLYDVDGDIDDLLKKMDLASRADDFVATFSRGMKQRLSIARSMIHKPRVLILDEPITGLDLQSKKVFYEMIKKLYSEGITILLTTHNLEEAEALCKKVAVMDRGRIIKSGEIGEIKAGATLEEAFIKLTGKSYE